MQLNIGLLLMIMAVATAVWFWRQSLQLREVANSVALEACERLSLQFLDGTSAFGTWRWQREAGRLRLRRIYVFDYTAKSIERRQGFVVLMSGRVESIGFAQERDQTPPATRTPTVNITMTYGAPLSDVEKNATDTAPRESAQILRLDDWRRNRRPDEPLH